jgi:ubiquinone/menaquinone biosynthesis C-methylase UbiE
MTDSNTDDETKNIAKTIDTYDKTADWYADKWADTAIMKDEADRFLSRLAGNRVLDVGCGSGRDTAYFVEQGMNVTGIDLSEEFLDIARENIPDAAFRRMDMRDTGFDDNSFDGIWACASVHHVPKDQIQAVLNEFRRILKNRGVVFIAVKQGEDETMVEKPHYDGGQKFFAFYRVDEMKQHLIDAGFDIVHMTVDTAPERKREGVQVIARLPED